MPDFSATDKAAIDKFFESGQEGGQPVSEEQTSNKAGDYDEALTTAKHFGEMALHGASFGLSPKIAYGIGSITGKGQEYENWVNQQIHTARAESPIASVIGELAGGLAVPIPGLGAGKAAATVIKGTGKLGTLGRHIVQGAVSGVGEGAVRGALQGYGEAGTSGLGEGAKAAMTPGIHGAVGGGIGGGVIGGIAGGLANRAQSARMAATGGGVGDITRQTRMSEGASPYKSWERIKSGPLNRAEEMDLFGKFGQSSENVAKRATEATDKIGKDMESILTTASKDPAGSIPKKDLEDIVLAVTARVRDDPNRNKTTTDAADRFLEWALPMFEGKRETVSVLDLHKIRQKIRESMIGPQHTGIPADNVTNKMLKDLRGELKPVMLDTVRRTEDGHVMSSLLEQKMTDFNAAATLRDLSQKSVPRWDSTMETLWGKGVRGMVSTMGFGPLLGPVQARMLSGVTSTPGVVPNSIMALDRARRMGLMPGAGKLGGVVAGKVASSSGD